MELGTTLERVEADKAFVLQSLVQLYAHDFGKHVPLQLASEFREAQLVMNPIARRGSAP